MSDFWTRERVARAIPALFCVSTMFPVVASVYRAPSPGWLAIADVATAALLVTMAIAVAVQNQRRVIDEDACRAFRAADSILLGVPALLVVFFVAGDAIDWTVLVVGLTWRGWLLVRTLPFLFAARRTVPNFDPAARTEAQ